MMNISQVSFIYPMVEAGGSRLSDLFFNFKFKSLSGDKTLMGTRPTPFKYQCMLLF